MTLPRPFPLAGATAAAALVTLQAGGALAQAQEPWPFVSLEIMRYDSLINTEEDVGLPCCFPHVVSNPDQVLLHISAEIDVPWSEDMDRVSVSYTDLTLTIDGLEEPITMIGFLERYGVFETGTRSLSASRPRDWPDHEAEDDEHVFMEHIWSVPADATTATLTFGELYAVEIDIPQDASQPLMPGDTADFEVTGITPVDGIVTAHSYYRQPVAGTVNPSAGQMVRVDFNITPLMYNSIGSSYEGFSFYTNSIQLVGPNGLPTIPVGQELGEGVLTRSTSNSISGDIVGDPFDKSFYFLTDGTPGTYTLYYFSDAVGEGTLGDVASDGGAEDEAEGGSSLFE